MKNTASLHWSPERHIAHEAVRDHGAMQKEAELEALLNVLNENPLNTVLEIGGMRGGTAWAWDQHGARCVVVIDKFVLEGRMECYSPTVFIEGDSQDADVVKNAARFGPYDFLFIDGNHSYEGVRRDFELYAPMVNPGGVIALHDVSVEQPARERPIHDIVPFWNQLRTLYEHQEIYDSEGAVWGGIGVLFVPTHNVDLVRAVTELETPAQDSPLRIATVMCDWDTCGCCGGKLQYGENTVCHSCAG